MPNTNHNPDKQPAVIDGRPLEQAAVLVQGVIALLNDQRMFCSSCKLYHYVSFAQHQHRRVLSEMVKKLNGIAKGLAHPEDEVPTHNTSSEAMRTDSRRG